MPDHKIQYLNRNAIDINKWNACIENAPNGLIYANTDYLDNACTNWDALVINDYEMVMPLPWRKKFGFRYVYTPYFISSLGVFGNTISEKVIKECFDIIKQKFSFCELDLNEKNIVRAEKKIKFYKRKNIFLSLNSSYDNLYKGYKRLARRKIHSGLENDLSIYRNVNPETIINEYEKNYEQNNRIIPSNSYKDLIKTIHALRTENYRTYLVKKENKVVAFYLLLTDQRYVYSLIGGSTQEGKKYGAFYLATDAAIKDFAQTGKVFRFEGSDKNGIAFFNLQFGSFPIDYYHVQINNLPWPFRYFK